MAAKPSSLFSISQLVVRLVIVAAIALATFDLLSSNTGLVQNYLLHKEITKVDSKAQQLKHQNMQLQRVLTSLRNDTDIVEFIARHDLRLVGKNEVFFEIPTQQTQVQNQ